MLVRGSLPNFVMKDSSGLKCANFVCLVLLAVEIFFQPAVVLLAAGLICFLM